MLYNLKAANILLQEYNLIKITVNRILLLLNVSIYNHGKNIKNGDTRRKGYKKEGKAPNETRIAMRRGTKARGKR